MNSQSSNSKAALRQHRWPEADSDQANTANMTPRLWNGQQKDKRILRGSCPPQICELEQNRNSCWAYLSKVWTATSWAKINNLQSLVWRVRMSRGMDENIYWELNHRQRAWSRPTSPIRKCIQGRGLWENVSCWLTTTRRDTTRGPALPQGVAVTSVSVHGELDTHLSWPGEKNKCLIQMNECEKSHAHTQAEEGSSCVFPPFHS